MYDDLLRVTIWNYISLFCVHIHSYRQKHRFLEGSWFGKYKMTACVNTEGSKPFLFCIRWFSKLFDGVDMDEYPFNIFLFFLEVFIIGIGGSVCNKMCPVDRMLITQGTILVIPFQVIILIVVHWSFHDIIIIWVKVLYIIMMMKFLIGIIGSWCFCGGCIRCSLMSNLRTNLENLFKN